jgi:hypothetical protein
MRTCRVQWSAAAIRALPARAAIWAVNLSGNRSHEPSRERAQVRGPRSGRTLGARAPYSTGRTAAGESRGKSGTGLHPRVVYRGSVLHRTLGPVHRAVQGVGVRPPGGGVSHATEEPTPHGTHKQHARPREEVGATQRRRASEGYITEPLLTHNLPKFSLRIADACKLGPTHTVPSPQSSRLGVFLFRVTWDTPLPRWFFLPTLRFCRFFVSLHRRRPSGCLSPAYASSRMRDVPRSLLPPATRRRKEEGG